MRRNRHIMSQQLMTQPRPAERRHHIKYSMALSAAGIIAAGLALTACDHSAAANITANGMVRVCQGGADNTDLTAGSQVAVVGPAGQVVGVGSLTEMPNPPAVDTTALYGDYTFTVKVTGGLPNYGIEIGTGAAPVWFSANKMKSGPAITVSGDGSCGP